MNEKEFNETVMSSIEEHLKTYTSEHIIDREEFAVCVPASPKILELRDPEVRHMVDFMGHQMTVMFTEKLMMEKLEGQVVGAPDGLWQSIKHYALEPILMDTRILDRLPYWLYRRYTRIFKPVRWKKFKFEAKAIYPDLELMRDRIILRIEQKR